MAGGELVGQRGGYRRQARARPRVRQDHEEALASRRGRSPPEHFFGWKNPVVPAERPVPLLGRSNPEDAVSPIQGNVESAEWSGAHPEDDSVDDDIAGCGVSIDDGCDRLRVRTLKPRLQHLHRTQREGAYDEHGRDEAEPPPGGDQQGRKGQCERRPGDSEIARAEEICADRADQGFANRRRDGEHEDQHQSPVEPP
jgi:hypothetical protein